MVNVHAEMVERPLAKLLQETIQAHFLRVLPVPEALAALRERRARIRCLLQLDRGQEQHPHSVLLLDHFQLRLSAELAWIERTIAALQKSGSNPGQGVENVGDAERGDS